MREELIAPCGMDCNVCSGYLALKHDVREKGVRIPYCKVADLETKGVLFSRKDASCF